MFHTACLFAIAITVYDVSGIGEPRNRAPLPQIYKAEPSTIDRFVHSQATILKTFKEVSLK
jgi:hypothetical protein